MNSFDFLFQVIECFNNSSLKYLKYSNASQTIELKKPNLLANKINETQDESIHETVSSKKNRITIYSDAIGYIYYPPNLKLESHILNKEEIAYIDVLGNRHLIFAQKNYKIINFFLNNGNPVEYGQAILEVEELE